VAARLCDRIAVMQGGRIVELGETGQVLRVPSHPYTRSLLAAQPGEALAGAMA
jgi:peptide/nickel transport system ATP-binding protein